MLRRILSIILCICLLVPFSSCENKPADSDDNKEASKYQAVIMETPNFKITAAMMSYFFNSYYHNFVETNSDYIKTAGLDTTKSLLVQKYSPEYTWFDYFMFNVSATVKERILLAEKAYELGYTLTEAEQKAIDDEIAKIDNYAINSGISQKALITDTYGEAVDADAIRECLRLGYFADHATNKMLSDYSFEDEEVNTHFEENKKSYLLFDYIRYQVDAKMAETAKSDFEKAETEEDFIELIKKYEREKVYDTTDEALNEKVEDCYGYEATYTADSSFTKWVYDNEHNAYDVYTQLHESGILLVAMLLPAKDEKYTEVLYRDAKPLHNVNSVLFPSIMYGGESNALAKANEVLASLSEDYTFEDVINEYDGGRTSNITYYSIPEDVAQWIFDESRAVGEIGVITSSDNGAYLIEMLEDGIPTWNFEVLTDLSNKTFKADVSALEKAYSLKLYNDNIKNVTPITIDN